MARVLVSITELADAVRALPTIDVDGERHYDGPRLLEAIAALTGNLDDYGEPRLPRMRPPGKIGAAAENELMPEAGDFRQNDPNYDPRFADTPEEAAERARLKALPPGPCVCTPLQEDREAPPDDHVHPGGDCSKCRCDDYVDTTVRDPRQARMDRGGEMPPVVVTPLPHVDPETTFDMRGDRRPAANANAFRPPSGPTNVLPSENLDAL